MSQLKETRPIHQILEVESFSGDSLKLHMGAWINFNNRRHETERIVPSNYSSLEYAVQEAWRESKANLISVENEIIKTQRMIDEAKADIILDELPKALEKLPKSANNADFRKAIIAKNEKYQTLNEHLEKLESINKHFETHTKELENTSRFLKKQMDYFIRSGSISGKLGV